MPSSSGVTLIEFSEEQRQASLSLPSGIGSAFEVVIQPDRSCFTVAVHSAMQRHPVMHLSMAMADGHFALEQNHSVSLFTRCVGGIVIFMQILSITESLVVCVSKLKSGAYEGWFSRASVH